MEQFFTVVAMGYRGAFEDETVFHNEAVPRRVSNVHLDVVEWSGDALAEDYPAFFVTTEARDVLIALGATGAEYEPVVVVYAEDDAGDPIVVPPLVQLIPVGKLAVDDISMTWPHKLVLSQRALDALRPLGLIDAVIDPYDPSRSST